MSRIERIVNRYCQSTNENSQEVEQDFTYWLISDKNEKEKDEALFTFWSSLDIAQDNSTKVAYKNILHKIDPNSLARHRKILSYNWLKYAATVALVAVSFFFLYNNKQRDAMVECMVPEGTSRTITLPDSSLIHLSPNSLFKYPKTFLNDGARQVYLSGEDFFSIQHMSNNPFIVQTDNLLVTVLGTKFNLSCFENKEYSTLILKEGKVEVSVDDRSIILTPNQKLRYNNSNKFIEIMAIASNEGSLFFKRASIQEVIRDYDNNKVITTDDKTIIGNQIPRYNYGVNVKLEYRKFDLYCLFQGVGKRDGFLGRDVIEPMGIFTAYKEHYTDSFNPLSKNPNMSAYYPRILGTESRHNYENFSHWVQDASYFRFKNFQIGYTFSFTKQGINKLRVSFSGQNIFTITKYRIYDPEKGLNAISFPNVSTYAFGVNLVI